MKTLLTLAAFIACFSGTYLVAEEAPVERKPEPVIEEITKEEFIQRCLERFEKADLNGDGVLSVEERKGMHEQLKQRHEKRKEKRLQKREEKHERKKQE